MRWKLLMLGGAGALVVAFAVITFQGATDLDAAPRAPSPPTSAPDDVMSHATDPAAVDPRDATPQMMRAQPEPMRTQPEATQAPTPSPPTDPAYPAAWFDADTPPLLSETFARVGSGKRLQPAKAIEVYHYAKDHPNDARAPLIMGYDAMNRGWMEMGVDHYLKAFRADPEMRRDPRMLEDLLNVAKNVLYHDKAAAALQEIYGESVRIALEQARAQGLSAR